MAFLLFAPSPTPIAKFKLILNRVKKYVEKDAVGRISYESWLKFTNHHQIFRLDLLLHFRKSWIWLSISQMQSI